MFPAGVMRPEKLTELHFCIKALCIQHEFESLACTCLYKLGLIKQQPWKKEANVEVPKTAAPLMAHKARQSP